MKTKFILLFCLLSSSLFAQESWTTITPKTEATPRHENSFVECEGKLYSLGGRGERPVDEYDPKTNTWTKLADAPMEIHHFQAISYQGEIWVVGALTGKYPHETPIPNILIFNPKTKTWRDGPTLPKDRMRGSAGVFVRNNKIYLVCGIQDGHFDGFVRWFDELDPKTGTWKSLPSAPRARDHVSAALVGDRLYLAGGRTSYAKIGKVLELTNNEIDYYDFKTNSWTTIEAEIPTPRAGNSNLGIGPYLVILNGESQAQTPPMPKWKYSIPAPTPGVSCPISIKVDTAQEQHFWMEKSGFRQVQPIVAEALRSAPWRYWSGKNKFQNQRI